MLALLTCLSLAGLLIAAPAPTPPKWPASYMVQGVLNLPYAEIAEPFTAYVDTKNKRSRIDYYGNLYKTYQRGDKGKFGQSFKITYMTVYENKTYNARTCFQVNGTNTSAVSFQQALPDLTNFVFVERNTHNQSLFRLKEIHGSKVNRFDMYVDGNNKPVQYVMMGLDTLFGSHYDKYVISYTNFGILPSKISFDPDKNVTCRGFPGPGSAEDRLLTNPFAEYIHGSSDHVDEMFSKFKSKYSKQYDTDKEHEHRRNVFLQNVRFIHSTNRNRALTFTVAVNHLADLTSDELMRMRGRIPSKVYNGGLPFDLSMPPKTPLRDVPDTLDWRLYGAVTQVKDQAVCGSCWSFGTTGTLEGALFFKTGRLVRLSQQALIDCSWGEGNNGCDGGEDFRAYQWIMRSGGIPTEDNYGQYLAVDGKCHARNMSIGATVASYTNISSGDLQSLKIAMAFHGPISVAIDAHLKSFSYYANGVYYDPQCLNGPDQLDHAVLAVGYGVMGGQPYWLVKNSWSTYWGNDGYVLMSQRNNNCGVATSATFVNM